MVAKPCSSLLFLKCLEDVKILGAPVISGHGRFIVNGDCLLPASCMSFHGRDLNQTLREYCDDWVIFGSLNRLFTSFHS